MIDEDVSMSDRAIQWDLDAQALNQLASNFDHDWGGIADMVTVTFFAKGILTGGPAALAGPIVTHGTRAPSAPSTSL